MTATRTRRFRGAILELDAPDDALLIQSAAGTTTDEQKTRASQPLPLPSPPFGSSIDLALALPRADADPGWTDTLVITVEELPENTLDEEWQSALTTRTLEAIPGFQIIDIGRWNGLSDATLVRTGLYIVDECSLTTLQWTWTIPHPDRPGARLGLSATFTCPTRDFDDRYEGFIDILNTAEAI